MTKKAFLLLTLILCLSVALIVAGCAEKDGEEVVAMSKMLAGGEDRKNLL
ncbi:MAG TPA: hypothetical protein PKL00_01465 [Bacillota bacterium]|nr:hypothetical protein [Bacillota bacterium]